MNLTSATKTATDPASPGRNCPLCPRLRDLRRQLRRDHPDWHNAPVPAFGNADARLLVVGLAPGKNGANRTGRPFTGDHAGDVLYPVLIETGFAAGSYRADPDDGFRLIDCMVTNAVLCLPPENKPVGAEIAACRQFLKKRIAMPRLTAIVALGRIAHDSTITAMGLRKSQFPFGHGAVHETSPPVFDTYHCSRYNMNTRRLTKPMILDVFRSARRRLGRDAGNTGTG